MYRIQCSEIWGGIKNLNTEVSTASVRASVYAQSAKGEKGGDFYYFSVCGADRVTRIVIGDVTGHGEEVSAFSQWVYEIMKAQMSQVKSCGILKKLNERIQNECFASLATLAIVCFYVQDKKLYISYAGHPPVLIGRKKDADWNPLLLGATPDVANLPIGVTRDVQYVDREIALETGDRLFFYTDGLIEARNQQGEAFGMDRLLASVRKIGMGDSAKVKEQVLCDLDAFASLLKLRDDFTLISAEVIA
ncbi:MAG: serine/threonine-protein phosphatase [Candidatus Omnitrophica bacterium]|nr:serine/threonine-protein phosphatase [Candidatus Omnitrophota bacterium]